MSCMCLDLHEGDNKDGNNKDGDNKDGDTHGKRT